MRELQNELSTLMNCVEAKYDNELNVIVKSADITPLKLMALVSENLGVSVFLMKSPSRKLEVVDARFIAMKLIRDKFDLKDKELGELFNRERTATYYCLQTVVGYLEVKCRPFIDKYMLCLKSQIELEGNER